ncbi:hypothetical protein PBRA_007745 [Plasmodiophora brassicae]|uniref:chitin synthase n=1 Tax=Plasmodiophora brassicae TaxID=37360 RepID=A0A0G4IY69_PLABS|nr:hypothetical protein PBRA_007745 [Plasmodiophora brassicae]
MATFVEAVEQFFRAYGPYIVYAIVWFFLLIAFLHAFSYFVTYVVTLGNVVIYGEKNQDHPFLTRFVAGTFLILYACYNVGVYSLLILTLNFRHAFWAFPWGTLDATLTIILMLEPLALVAVSWFKVGCAVNSWRRAPSEDEVLRALSEGRKKKTNPYVTVVMPIYNEPIETLMIAINSVTKTKYPLNRLHLVLAFDSDEVSTLYRSVIYCLMTNKTKIDYEKLSTSEGLDELGVSSEAREFPVIGDIMYRNLKVTPCRFEHGGKRHAQMCAFRYLSSLYKNQETKPLLLFIDSDIELEVHAIPNFIYDMNRQPGIYREALTGLITCKTAGTYSFLKVLQDTEYIESQMLQRNSEDYLGSVSCLPGALTMVRFETLASVAPVYFGNMDAVDTFDFNRTHLGEDRYLTHLIMEKRPEKYRIGFCPSARCKTEGCETFRSLMKQRRRWYLGTVTNEIYQLTSPIIWRQFPGLNCLIGLSALQNGPLFIYVFFLQILQGQGTWYSYGYAVGIFGPIWMFIIFVGWKIGRRKITWFYPIVLVCLPIMAASFQVYGMMTFNVRTWGGPRAAAARKVLPLPISQEGIKADSSQAV